MQIILDELVVRDGANMLSPIHQEALTFHRHARTMIIVMKHAAGVKMIAIVLS